MADSEIANDGSNSTVYILVSGPNGDTDSETSILFGTGCEANYKFDMSCCPDGDACVINTLSASNAHACTGIGV
jgi:hypothetical protein